MEMIEQVANYVIAKTNESGIPMTNFRLSKTLYLINVEYFKANGKLLFDNPVVITNNGIFYREIYHKHKMHERRVIPHIAPSDALKIKNVDMYTISRTVMICNSKQNLVLKNVCLAAVQQNEAEQIFEYIN